MPEHPPAANAWGGWRRAVRPVAILALVAGCAPARTPAPSGLAAPLTDSDVRMVAALLRMEDRRALEPEAVRAAASDANPEVRRRAALAAGRVGGDGAVPLLVHLLADPDTAVAATAAFGLGLRADSGSVAPLAATIGRDRAARPTVAAEAASSLGAIRTDAAADALRDLLRTTPVGSTGDAVVEHALLAVWRHPRDPDPETVLRWTRAASPELRWRAAYAVVRRPDPRATPRLLELAGDPDPAVRAVAVRGLTRALADSAGIAADAVVPVLLERSRDADRPTAVNAVRSLGTWGDGRVTDALLDLLAGEHWLAITAAESLGRLGTTAASAAPALDAVARSAAHPVGLRSAALAALVTVDPGLAGAAAGMLAAQPDAWRLRMAAGRTAAALRAPELVASLARDADPRVVAATLQAVADAGEPSPAQRRLALESLGSPDVGVRTAALNTLARVPAPDLLPLLLDAFADALDDASLNAALAAVDALEAVREAGTPVWPALSLRHARIDSPLVRARLIQHFGTAARERWGEVNPVDTWLDPQDYHDIVDRWLGGRGPGNANPRAVIRTASGEFTLLLFASDAPLTVRSFVSLAEQGYFDGQEWPRVVPNFVIQGGDPRGDQTGGPGYALRDELNRHRYGRGTLGMALSGPDTGGSQFFIAHSPQPHLDGGYTVFGEVVAGMDVVDRVVVGETIETVRVEWAPPGRP
jgi:cyclophilin family peptidyl-prolyl cis-trans isomerase/HEAT repeat protein